MSDALGICLQATQKAKAKRKEVFKRAEQYVKEYREQVCAILRPVILDGCSSNISVYLVAGVWLFGWSNPLYANLRYNAISRIIQPQYWSCY